MTVNHHGKQYDTENLPVWAQEFITKLVSERQIAKRKLNEYLDEQTPTKIWTTVWRNNDLQRRYIKDRGVIFQVGKDQIEVYESHDHPGELTIMVTQGKWMVVRPSVANVIRVSVEE